MKGILYTIAVAALTLTACSGGGGKFIGKWRPVGDQDAGHVVVIEQKGDGYNIYDEGQPNQALTLTYDKHSDRLMLQQNGDTAITVAYDAASHHLIANTSADRKELERAD